MFAIKLVRQHCGIQPHKMYIILILLNTHKIGTLVIIINVGILVSFLFWCCWFSVVVVFVKPVVLSLQDHNKENAKTIACMYSLLAAAILTDIDCGRTALETIKKGKNMEVNEHQYFFSRSFDASKELQLKLKEKKKNSKSQTMKIHQRIKANNSFI